MLLETNRLYLRKWKEEDVELLYLYAKDERIGPITGWPVHKSIEDSKFVLENVLMQEGNYALCLKDHTLIGCIGIMNQQTSNMNVGENEYEIGYWLGVPYWGNGYVPEIVNGVIEYLFNNGCKRIWCGYFDGNDKSKRVNEKCGFKYVRTNNNYYCKPMNEYRILHIHCKEIGLFI